MPLHGKMIHSTFKILNKNLYMISEIEITWFIFVTKETLKNKIAHFADFPMVKNILWIFSSVYFNYFLLYIFYFNCLCCLSHSFANTIKILFTILTWNISSNTTPSFNVKSCSASKYKHISILVITISTSAKCNLQ